MMRRNGSMPKVVVCVIAFFGLVYFIYLYNDLSGQLKNTERSAERYRREQESVSAQLQDQIIAKDELKQRCDNDKVQLTNRLNSQQQQYKMLKSQHEDMETEFGRLKNEKEKENEEHNKQDEERAIEYNQYKQEKSLEIASLKDSVANLEREKEQLSQQVAELKTQLQGTLNEANKAKETIVTLQNEVKIQQSQLQTDRLTIQRNQGLLNYAQNLVQQAQAKQQQIEQQYQQLQQQQQQQQNIGGQQGANFQGLGQQQQNIGGQQGANLQGMGQPQQGMNLQGGNQQGAGFNQQQQQQQQGGFMGHGLNQGQGGVQGHQQNVLPNDGNILGNLVHGGAGGINPNVIGQQAGNAVKIADNAENFNIADDIMKSLQEKHKPVDADLLEEHQKQHQIIPPGGDQDKSYERHGDTDQGALGHQKHGQSMLGQDGHGIQQEQHQIGKPNLDHEPIVNRLGSKDVDTNVHGADGNHDNRIENQGPVNLQVQEPNLHGEADKNKLLKDDDLRFRPHIPIPDNQIQPIVPVDDSHRQEQLDIPLGKGNKEDEDKNEERQGAGGIADEDNDDEYDDDYDKENDKDEY